MKKAIRGIEYLFVLILTAFVNSLGEREALRFGASLGVFLRRLLPYRSYVVTENLRICGLYQSDPRRLDLFVIRCFQHLGVTAVELLRQKSYSEADIRSKVVFDKHEHLRSAAALGRGVLLLSAHIGNWELSGSYMSRIGYPVDLLVKRQNNQRVDKLINSFRDSQGVGVIYTDTGLKSLITAFRNKRFVAILADQYGRAESEPAILFGRETMVPAGPAVLIEKYDLPMVFGFLRRAKNGRHYLHTRLVTDWDGMSRNRIVQIYADLTERAIRIAPEMWLWTHRKFKNLTDYKRSRGD